MGGTVTGGNFNIPISAVAATFLVGAPPPPPPAQAVVGNQTGNPIQFFGVSPTNPATVRTQSNSQQVFTFDSTSRPGIPSAFRYANDANFLGRTAMPGQLLVLPGNGWFRGTQYFVCASGTITIPLSAQNAGVSFTLYSNKFVNLASSGLNIQITSDALASLPNTSLGANLNSYTWSLVAPISGGLSGQTDQRSRRTMISCRCTTKAPNDVVVERGPISWQFTIGAIAAAGFAGCADRFSAAIAISDDV